MQLLVGLEIKAIYDGLLAIGGGSGGCAGHSDTASGACKRPGLAVGSALPGR
jgi:hypothetical protein